jgi:hypothetical protein
MTTSDARRSRFWGDTPRRIKWLFILSLLLIVVACAGAGILFWQNVVWGWEATRFAGETGSYDAGMYYSRGRHFLLEIALIDESDKLDKTPYRSLYELQPSGRRTNGCDIWFLYISPNMGRPHRVAQETYVKAFNHRMRTICENPEWFDARGERLPDDDGVTNRAKFKVIPD